MTKLQRYIPIVYEDGGDLLVKLKPSHRKKPEYDDEVYKVDEADNKIHNLEICLTDCMEENEELQARIERLESLLNRFIKASPRGWNLVREAEKEFEKLRSDV